MTSSLTRALHSSNRYAILATQPNEKAESDSEKSKVVADRKIRCAIYKKYCFIFMTKGRCTNGRYCGFAHDVKELKPSIQKQKREDNCPDGEKCMYLPVHSCLFKHEGEVSIASKVPDRIIKVFFHDLRQTKKSKAKGDVEKKRKSESDKREEKTVSRTSPRLEEAASTIGDEHKIGLLNTENDEKIETTNNQRARLPPIGTPSKALSSNP